jgi:hypothetical protein
VKSNPVSPGLFNQPFPLATPAAGSYTITITRSASATPPSSSVIPGVMVYIPACVNVWVRAHLPSAASNDCTAEPSSHRIVQVWVSFVPGSLKVVPSVTGSPTRKSCHGAGVTMPGGGSAAAAGLSAANPGIRL